MRKPARTLIAGIALAIPLFPPLAGVATSQESQALNGQVQLGDVSASQTLEVQLVEDYTAAITSATGNSFSAAVEEGDLDVESSQQLEGDVNASTLLTVSPGGDTGFTTELTTAATGNTGDASSLGGGALTGTFTQETAADVDVTASSWTEAPEASAGDVSSSSQAIANTQGLGAVGGAIDATVAQSSGANVQASDGAELQYTPGVAAWSALAVGNNVTSTGTAGSTHVLSADQSQTGDLVEASTFVGIGNGQEISNAATATGNNLSATNEYEVLDVTAMQLNESTISADAETQMALFGSSAVVASGVGNSVMAGDNGGQIVLNNTQTNSGGGVFASASSIGDDGYDLSATSTAMGNAATGYACTTCGGRMTVGNTQTNAAPVRATSTARSTTWARSVSGVATAVGNSGNFYVSSPDE